MIQSGTPLTPPGLKRKTLAAFPPETGNPASRRICVGCKSNDADHGKLSAIGIMKKANRRFSPASSADTRKFIIFLLNIDFLSL